MTAEIYDAIYAFKDYEAEAKQLTQLIDTYKQTDGNTLLDVACGTGAHLPYLKDRFEVTGVDLSHEQVMAAKARLPGVKFVEADMRDFDLGKQFDVVTCLFSSIGYMEQPEDLQAAVSNMARHLKKGGVLVIEPWLTRDRYDPNHESQPDTGTLENGTKVKRVAHHGVEGNTSVIRMHHELDGPNGHTEFDEVRRLAMHSAHDFMDAFDAAGLSFHIDDHGLQPGSQESRGLYIGTKRIDAQ